jgi:predicted metal-dependent hydrolase
MNRKRSRVAALTKSFEGRNLDPRYLGYFECFNRHDFFEAHEVLEELWLPIRGTPEAAYYKGLIQLAGAFVHVQKNRLGPAQALLRLAQANLQSFTASHEGLDLVSVLAMIEEWIRKLRSDSEAIELSGAAVEDVRLPLPAESGTHNSGGN